MNLNNFFKVLLYLRSSIFNASLKIHNLELKTKIEPYLLCVVLKSFKQRVTLEETYVYFKTKLLLVKLYFILKYKSYLRFMKKKVFCKLFALQCTDKINKTTKKVTLNYC